MKKISIVVVKKKNSYLLFNRPETYLSAMKCSNRFENGQVRFLTVSLKIGGKIAIVEIDFEMICRQCRRFAPKIHLKLVWHFRLKFKASENP